MVHVKVVIRKKKNKDGLMPIAIRITKDRKQNFIHVANIKENEWDAKNQRVNTKHPNSARLNSFITTKLAEASEKVLEVEIQKESVTAKMLKQKVKNAKGGTFLPQARLYLKNLKDTGKFNQHSSDSPRVKHFQEFLGGKDILFSEISEDLLKRYSLYLKKTRKISDRTVINHLVLIRSVFSQAITAQAADPKYYPFGRGKIKIKFPDSQKIGLEPEEVKQLQELILPLGSTPNHARNLWLVSFYFAGMRISDVLRLRWSDFQNDRLYYLMGKNNKAGSLKVSPYILEILEQYKSSRQGEDELVFPDLKHIRDFSDEYEVKRQIAVAIKRIDTALQKKVRPLLKLEKNLTMHIARHTFGNISGDKIPVQMLQKLYRHSSITTTIGYQANFINKDADDALDAVLNI
jgi:integrase